jgi:hypothetical protein
MNINFGRGIVTTNIIGSFYIMLKFRGKVIIPRLGNNVKLKVRGNILLIEGKFDNSDDNLLFNYYGEFKPITAKNMLNKKTIKIKPKGLDYWEESDGATWDDDQSIWGEGGATYTHIKKIKRKLK